MRIRLFCGCLDFYPRSPCGERRLWACPDGSARLFLSTLSLRRATLAGPSGPAFLFNFYPRSPCGERPTDMAKRLIEFRISIHALLAESDERKSHRRIRPERFLSTLSLRRATIALLIQPTKKQDFYPRSPCGERHCNLTQKRHPPSQFLSTLSLRRATYGCYSLRHSAQFLSTLSLRRATRKGFAMRWNTCISIHALLAESDDNGRMRDAENLTISIHALLAESDSKHRALKSRRIVFLSTLSLRRAT